MTRVKNWEIKCAYCGESFCSNHLRAKYCCDAHRHKAFIARQKVERELSASKWTEQEQELIDELAPYFGDAAEDVFENLNALICSGKRAQWVDNLKALKIVIRACSKTVQRECAKLVRMESDIVVADMADILEREYGVNFHD